MKKIVLLLMGLAFVFLPRSDVSAQTCSGTFTCTSSWTSVCTNDFDGSTCSAGTNDCTCREECTGTDWTRSCASCSSRSSSDCSISGACDGVSCICTTGGCGWTTGPTPTPGGPPTPTSGSTGCSSPDATYYCDSARTNSLFARAYDFREETICNNNYFTPVNNDVFCGGVCDWSVQTWAGYVDIPEGSVSFRYQVENSFENDLRIGMSQGGDGWYSPVESYYAPGEPGTFEDYFVGGGGPVEILSDYVYVCDDGDVVEGASDCGDESWDNVKWRRYTTDTYNMRAGRYYVKIVSWERDNSHNDAKAVQC